jgi:predicted enzyme related to lactoylglutathione lyase
MAGAAQTRSRVGTFTWEELTTTDLDAALDFYGNVFGFEYSEQELEDGGTYALLYAGDTMIGGAFEVAGQPPAWSSYVSVEDVEASVAAAVELGATVHHDPFDVMDIGRMAVLEDPTGAIIQPWQSVGTGRKGAGAAATTNGLVTWRELRSTDIDAAVEFYRTWMGWTSEPRDMGSFTYWVFSTDGQQVGGCMQITPEMGDMPSHWRPIFHHDDVDEAYATASTFDVVTLMQPGPLDVGYYAELLDPQGANFGIMKPSASGF